MKIFQSINTTFSIISWPFSCQLPGNHGFSSVVGKACDRLELSLAVLSVICSRSLTKPYSSPCFKWKHSSGRGRHELHSFCLAIFWKSFCYRKQIYRMGSCSEAPLFLNSRSISTHNYFAPLVCGLWICREHTHYNAHNWSWISQVCLFLLLRCYCYLIYSGIQQSDVVAPHDNSVNHVNVVLLIVTNIIYTIKLTSALLN